MSVSSRSLEASVDQAERPGFWTQRRDCQQAQGRLVGFDGNEVEHAVHTPEEEGKRGHTRRTFNSEPRGAKGASSMTVGIDEVLNTRPTETPGYPPIDSARFSRQTWFWAGRVVSLIQLTVQNYSPVLSIAVKPALSARKGYPLPRARLFTFA